MSRWLVVLTKPRMEDEAQDNLLRQGFAVYLPKWVTFKRSNKSWQKQCVAMFPRYLFVQPTFEEQSVLPVRSTRGVSQIVRFGQEPVWASQDLIDQIRGIEQMRQRVAESLTPLKAGDWVQITAGAFAGVQAEVFECDQQRAIVLMKVLGKLQRLSVQIAAVKTL